MEKFDILDNCRSFHFISIGGVSMSGLAEILHHNGFVISGSDQHDSENVARMRDLGICAKIGHNPENIPQNCQVVIYNAAVAENNAEMVAARARGLHLMARGELLGRLMKNYGQAICVAGTHGKTTTTSMLAAIFMHAGKDPTIHNGGILPSIGTPTRIGGRDFFIAEACEYHDAFLQFFPTTGIILNMEMDHDDFFADIHALRRSFQNFAKKIPKEGLLVIGENLDLDGFLHEINCNLEIIGDNFRAENIGFDSQGRGFFSLFRGKANLGQINLSLPGHHNIQNAMAAATCAIHHSIDFEDIQNALVAFTGARRRFEKIGKFMDADVVDDFAHHPTEISATLSAAKNIPHRRLWAVFQPHTHARTLQHLPNLAKSLGGSDETIVLDIYSPAGRGDLAHAVHALDLVEEMGRLGLDAHYAADFDAAKKLLAAQLRPGDMVIVMGAGDVNVLAHKLVES